MDDKHKTKSQLIAELKQLRQEIDEMNRSNERESVKPERLLLEAQRIAKIGSWEYDIATDSPFWSPEMFSLFDFDPADGMPDWQSQRDRIHPYDRIVFEEAVRDAIQREMSYQKDFRIIKRDDTIIWARTIGNVQKNEDGDIVALYGTVQNITEQKLITISLRESEAYYRGLFENSMLGVSQTRPDGHIIRANTAFIQMYGYDNFDEMRSLIENNVTQMYVHPEERKDVLHLIDSKGYMPPREFRVRKKDGTEFTVLACARSISDDHGNIYCYQAELIDISQLKEVEHSFVMTNLNLQNAQRIGHIGNWIWDVSKETLLWSDELYRIFGVEHGFELTYENIESMIVPEDRPYNTEMVQSLLSNSSGSINYEMRIQTPDGEIKYIEQSIEVTGTVINGTIQDITQRKKTEILLSENRENLKAIIENAPGSIWSVDNQYRLITGNSRFHKDIALVFGEPLQPGDTVLQSFLPQDELNVWRSYYDRALAGEHFTIERKRHFTPSPQFIEYSFNPILDNSGNTDGVTVLGLDITEKKRAAEILQQSEHILNETGRMARIGGWEHDMATGEAVWTAALYEIIELDPHEKPPGIKEHLDYYPPESRNILKAAYSRLIEEGEPFDLELVIYTIGKKLLWCRAYGEPVYKNGELVKIRGTFQDISERKEAEQKIKESEEKFRIAFNVSSNLMMLVDIDTNTIIDVNMAYTEVLGYTRDEVIGKSGKLGFTIKNRQEVADLMQKLKEDNHFRDYESVLLTKNGDEIFCLIYAAPIDFYKRHLHIINIIDITNRKLSEMALKQSEERHRLLFDTASMGIGYYSIDGRIISYNRAAAANMNGKPEDFAGRSLLEIFGPEHGAIYMERINEVIKQQDAIQYEDLVSLPTGDKWFVTVYNRITDTTGEVIGVQVTSNNITERKEAELALRNISKFPDENPYPVMRLTYSGDILYTNKSGSLLLDSMISTKTKRMKRTWLNSIQAAVKSGNIERKEIQVDGNEFLLTIVPFTEQSYINIYGSDITRLKQAQLELKQVASSIQDAREKERLGIARELHDEIGQMLTGIKMDIAHFRHIIPEFNDRIEAHIETLQNMTDQAIECVRRVSSDLRPTILDDFGLLAAIEWYLEQFQKRFGIHCQVMLPKHEPTIDERLSVALYRIIQETLTNVARHAEASKVRIKFTVTDHQIALSIRDNGQGIGESAIQDSNSLGIIGIRERVSEFNGTFEIIDMHGEGTRVEISIPFREHDTIY